MPARPRFPRTLICAVAALVFPLCSPANSAPKTTVYRAAEGRTSDTRSITPVAFKIYVLPKGQCPPCEALKQRIAAYPHVNITRSKQRQSPFAGYPTVMYMDGWIDNGERIHHGQYQLYPALKPTIEFVEVGE